EIEQRGQMLEVEQPASDPTLYCDPVRVAQMIGNLLHNATKYTPAHGRIRLSASVNERNLVICIADNGKGIEPHMLDHIFELFSRARQEAELADGLGIGLSVVRNMATLHEGTVAAHSKGLEQGSEFVLTLPVVTDAKTDAEDTESHGQGPASACNIL